MGKLHSIFSVGLRWIPECTLDDYVTVARWAYFVGARRPDSLESTPPPFPPSLA
jgi:hypothetical protein